jgi:hypothetical protein
MIRTMMVLVGFLGLAACGAVPERAAAVANVDGDHHLTVRAEGGHLWWSHRPWSEPHDVCRLPGEGAVENLAVRPVLTGSGETFEISFEQDGAAWHGRIVLDEASMLDTPVAFLRGSDHFARETTLAGELARSGR